MSKHKRRKRKSNYQLGGMLGGLFGSGGGGDFLKSISGALQAFNNEPAMQGIFGQSNNLLQGFQQQADQAGVSIDQDKFRGMFDLASLFSTSSFGRSIFDDGGFVRKGKGLRNEVGQRIGDITDAAIEFQYEQTKNTAKQQFNQQYGDKQIPPREIIPGLEKEPLPPTPGQKFQTGGIPTSPLGQFAYPNQPVNVPTPNGQITMDGVNHPLMAIDSTGQQRLLQPNSGMHQFAPGNVLEIPVEQPPKRRRRRKKKGMGAELKDLPHIKMKDTLSHRIPRATVRNFNKRNRLQMRKNKANNTQNLPFGR